MAITIVTNGHERFPVYAYELTARERESLGIVLNECPSDTDGCSGGPGCPDSDAGNDPYAEYVRYRGSLYPLSDFSASWGMSRDAGLPAEFAGWDGYLSDTYFSGVVVRYVREGDRIDTDRIVVGRFFVSDDATDGE
jgi:hypothetical protein